MAINKWQAFAIAAIWLVVGLSAFAGAPGVTVCIAVLAAVATVVIVDF
jgi:hypothetical protein